MASCSEKSLGDEPSQLIEPRYGDLIDLFEAVQQENFNDEHELCERFHARFPHVKIGRPRRFFNSVQRIAAPVKPSSTGSVAIQGCNLAAYREHVWVPRVRNVCSGETIYPKILQEYGLTEELLGELFCQICDDPNACIHWTLPQQPTVGFYKALHNHLKTFGNIATITSVGRFYVAIDPAMKARKSRPDNVHRFVEKLCKLPPHEPVDYKREKTQKKELDLMKVELDQCHETVENMSHEFDELKQLYKLTQQKLQDTEKALRDVTNQQAKLKKSRDFAKDKLAQKTQQYVSLQSEYAELYMENMHLSEPVTDQESQEAETHQLIATKQGKSYAPEVRKLYYSLLADEVPASKIASIIRTVLKTFEPDVDVEELQLPQRSCASYMRRDELATVNNAHKATILGETSCLHLNTDGTTKNQKKLNGIVINDVVVSVNEVADGAAVSVVEDISRELATLRETAQALKLPNAESINWTLIESSTSDSAATQKCLNKLIEERRDQDAETFGTATAETVDIVQNFCSMHLGINLRKAFLSGIDTSESSGDQSRKYHRVDSFVHEFCKVFGLHGTPEYACGVQSFPDFLELMRSNPTSTDTAEYFAQCASIKLQRQVGSRYFVSAYNAARIVFLKEAAIRFLAFTGKSNSGNKLEKEVHSKLQDPLELVELRADSLMFYHIYADLVMLSKSKDLGKSALDMNQHYLELKDFLCEVESNVGCVLNREHQVFKSEKRLYADDARKTNHRLHKEMTVIANHLFTIPETEKSALERALVAGSAAMLEKLCSYAHNQLPGGEYWEPDPHTKDVLSKLSPSNDICESVLGLNDYLTTAVRNLDQAARSNMVQAKKNKAIKWLNSLPDDFQSSVVSLAVKERNSVASKVKACKQERAAQRQQAMMKAHHQREALEKKKQVEKEKLSQQHLITSVHELSAVMSKIEEEDCTTASKKSKKLAVIRTQINIRKKVLKQSINIVLTHARKQRPVPELVEELSAFIQEHGPHSELLKKPQSMVGCRIEHRFETDDGTKWFTGTVVGYDSTTYFHEIVYDEEQEHCFFDLSSDIANGDIFVTD